MRNYSEETEKRIAFIQERLAEAKAAGIVFANSGGKDCALVGILCKMACENTVGIIMPCGSKRNYGADKDDAETFAAQYGIETRYIDLTPTRDALVQAVGKTLSQHVAANIAPRLRMNVLYAVAASENRLVPGTGNRSEAHMGYFTKWADGLHGCDFNPIADLTVGEVYDFLRHLGAPCCVIDKAPSAGLYDGQTDEGDMGDRRSQRGGSGGDALKLASQRQGSRDTRGDGPGARRRTRSVRARTQRLRSAGIQRGDAPV
jgi:NAD+ synthase